jgi:DNA-binding MarR family transcriptional regulator
MAKGRSARERTVDAAMEASRALLGVAVQSLAPVLEQVSLPQFRVLVLLSESGSMRSGLLAEHLGVHPSTLTRMADRLVAAGWIERQEAPASRREVHLALSGTGAELVSEVTHRRREALAEILDPLPKASRQQILTGLELFAEAAGEPAGGPVTALGI